MNGIANYKSGYRNYQEQVGEDTYVERKKAAVRGYTKIEYMEKRVIDYSLVVLFILLLWPIFIYVAYRIRKESPGPIFYRQSRVGIEGKPFTCYKFRSMHENGYFDPYTKDNDSRIFRFGHTMRRYRIDELPQLVNILKGDMHMVGPRAEWDILVKEYEQEIKNYNVRSLVRPGITGLAQVRYRYGRNIYDTKQKLKYDKAYIRNWSLWLEMKILLETVLVVLRKQGV